MTIKESLNGIKISNSGHAQISIN